MAKISSKNIAEAVYKATEGKSPAEQELLLKRTVYVLRDKRMLGKSKDILEALQHIIDKKTNTVRLKVITAKNIKEEEREKLEDQIKVKYKGDKVISEFFVKEELLGGMRVEVGDEVQDTTYKNKLRKLEKFLIQNK